MNSKLVGRIANDLSIPSFRNETPQHYEARVLYSALRYWIEAACIDDGRNGADGVKVQTITRTVRHILCLALKTVPEARPWFEASKTNPAAIAYNALVDIDDLLMVGETGNVLCTKPRLRALCCEIAYATGFIDQSSAVTVEGKSNRGFITSGLASIVPGLYANPIFPSVSFEDQWQSLREYLHWVPLRDFGPIEFLSPTSWKSSVMSVEAVDSSLQILSACSVAVARDPFRGNGVQRFCLVEHGATGVHVAKVPKGMAQSVFLWEKYKCGRSAELVVDHLDERYVRVEAFLYLLPADCQRVLRAAVWPDARIGDTRVYIARSELLPLVEAVADQAFMRLRRKC